MKLCTWNLFFDSSHFIGVMGLWFFYLYKICREQSLCALLLLQFSSNFTETLQESFLLYEAVHLYFFLIHHFYYGILNFFTYIEYIGNIFCVRFFSYSLQPTFLESFVPLEVVHLWFTFEFTQNTGVNGLSFLFRLYIDIDSLSDYILTLIGYGGGEYSFACGLHF